LFHRVTDRAQDNRDLVLLKKNRDLAIWAQPALAKRPREPRHSHRLTAAQRHGANSLAGGATERMEPASSSPAAPPRQGKETNWPMNVQGATEMGGVL